MKELAVAHDLSRPHPDWLIPEFGPELAVEGFMTTRAGGVSLAPHASMNIGSGVGDEPEAVAENRRRVAQASGGTPVYVWQVHGAKVSHLQPEHALPGACPVQADASISTSPELAVAIQAADCLPVLFAAPGGVGGAHAGWRGLAAGVLENTVQALCEAVHCRPDQVQAWMGACIGPQVFEVGADVLAAFGQSDAPIDSEFFRYQPNTQGEPRWRADLLGLARQRLRAAGLIHIRGGHWCTYSESSRFFSFRREAQGGRMVAVLRLR